MISKDKKYTTRDGREVRIYATDGPEGQNIHGAICSEKLWTIHCWSKEGAAGWGASDLDLIEVKPRIKRTVWLNLYEGGVVLSEERPNVAKMFDSRLACVKVEIDCEEGEGL